MFQVNLQEDETILGAYRQSKATLLKPVGLALAAVLIPVYFLYRFQLFFDYLRWVGLWSLLWLFYASYKALLWNLDVMLITNKRLLKATYSSLFKKDIFETPWHRVANIGFKTTGMLSSLFRFGDLYIHITSLNQPVVAQNMPKTSELKDLLWKVHAASVGSHFS